MAQTSDTQELKVFLSTHIERPATNDEATKLIKKKLGLKYTSPAQALMVVCEAPPPMESRGQLRARKKQKAIADDAILSDNITDQLWPGMLVADIPDVGKGVVCTKVLQRGNLLCDYNSLLLEGDNASAYLKRSRNWLSKWQRIIMHLSSTCSTMKRKWLDESG